VDTALVTRTEIQQLTI